MKQRHFITTLCLLMLFVTSAWAQKNTLEIPDVTVAQGKSISLPVNMENSADIVAVQFTMTTADGVTFSTETARTTERADGHSLTMRSIGVNKYMVMIFSSQNRAFIGRTGSIMTVVLNTSSSLKEGDKIPITLSDVIIGEKSGKNLATGFTSGSVNIAKSPDLEVSQVETKATNLLPYNKISVNWQVSNIGGLSTEAGWSEQVFAESADGKFSKLLGTIDCDQKLAAGGTISRTAEFDTPMELGISDNARIRVKVRPYSNTGEPSWMLANNEATTSGTLQTANMLFINPAAAHIEEANAQNVRLMLIRSGSTAQAETFKLTQTADARIELPAEITIPQGQSATYFYAKVIANQKLDNDSIVTVNIDGNNYMTGTTAIKLTDDTKPQLTLSAKQQDVTEGGKLTLTITAERQSATDKAISLSCDLPSRFRIPANIILPARKTSVDVEVEALEDDIPDVEKVVTFAASADGYENGTLLSTLVDDDIPTLQLELTPTAISEADGPLSVSAKLSRTDNIDKKVTVKLSDNSEGNLYYARQTIEMAPGVKEVTLNMGPIDNSLVDGERTYQVTAAVFIASCSCNANVGTSGGVVTVPLTIYDNDGPALSLSASSSLLKEGGEMTLTISRNTDSKSRLDVNLSSNHDAAIEYPKTVTIAEGETSATFTVKSKGNDTTGDDLTATLIAESEGFAKSSVWFTISDQTLPDARIMAISSQESKVEAGGKTTLSLSIANQGSYVLPEQTKIGFYFDSAATPADVAYLQDNLAAGESTTMMREITLPTTVGEHKLYAVVNDGQGVKELLYTNNTSDVLNIATVAPISMETKVAKAIYAPGEKVVISGKAKGKDIAKKSVEVYIVNGGYRHTITTQTQDDGSFEVSYEPYSGQTGHFAVGACYPSANLSEEQASFDIYGIKRTSNDAITCEASLGDVYQGKLNISNPGNLTLTGLKVKVNSKPDNCTVNATPGTTTLKGGESTDIAFSITPSGASEGSDWEKIELSIESAEGAVLPATLYYYCRVKTGKIEASVASIKTTMVKGESRDYPFTITNVGKGETGKISLALPSWISSVTPMEMPSLAKDESTEIILRMTPTDKMQLNVPVTGNIAINCANGEGMPLPFYIEPVSTKEGKLTIDVCDENTYYTKEAPHLAGAKVEITHPTTGAVVAKGITNEKGLFSADLTEGYYAVRVSAEKHDSYSNNLLVDPGTETKKVVNLSYEAINIDWKVEETEIQDEYEIKTNVKFETQVPVPVVELTVPDRIYTENLRKGESLIFNATLTNKGLITAKDVQLLLPDTVTSWRFEPIGPGKANELAPGQSIEIPIRVSEGPGDDGPCVVYIGTLYYWECGPDKKWHKYYKSMQITICKGRVTVVEYPSTGSGGGSGPGGGPGGGGGGSYGPSSDIPTVTQKVDKSCNPCLNMYIQKITECGVNVGLSLLKNNPLGCIVGLGFCARDLNKDFHSWRSWGGCVASAVGCIPGIGPVPTLVGCLISLTEPCEANNASAKMRAGNSSNYSEPSYITDFKNKLAIPLQESKAFQNLLLEYFGDEVWVNETNGEALQDLMVMLQTSEEEVLTADNYIKYKPQNVTKEQYYKFIERLNNTALAKTDDGNYIDLSKVAGYVNEINSANEQSVLMGYESTTDMLRKEYALLKGRLEESSSSVCSSITLQFTQKMVMTRQAFRGTLKVFNGNEQEAMKDVKLTLTVTDEKGNIAMSDKFQVNPEKLEGFNGKLDFTDGWTLDAQKEGVATVLFIPTKKAAPTVETRYAFGGTLSYVDPFTGLEVTRDLTPITLTVKPSPNLDLTYFMQRDIKGDDPLTKEVEPSEEAEFSLLINNLGYGDATNVRMSTNQPEIVDNEKGLKVKFELMSSQLNGQEKTLALGGSVSTDFGTIPAHSTSYAQWWIKSSLLGHFTDYDVTATHLTSYGNKDLSLLNDVTIHELIRSIDVTKGDKTLKGFMTNDIVDADDTPDMLYLSDGEIEKVNVAASSSITKTSDTEYTLTITPSEEGWNYGNLSDPTYGVSALKSVTRASDGKQISLRNFWQTDRTLRDGKDPLYENRIHFADQFDGKNAESYILTFEATPSLMLEVASIEGAPAEDEVATQPVNTLKVMFNKYIDPATFTSEDIQINVQGKEQDSQLVKISTEDNKNFVLDLTQLNASAGNGYYTLTVQTSGITDSEGFAGKTGKTASWTLFVNSQVKLLTSVYPENAGEVIGRVAGNEVAYGTTIQLVAKAKEGYQFASWSLNGETISTNDTISQVALGDLTMVANFEKKTYQVNIAENCEGGSITQSYTGVYHYGDQLVLKAEADEDYSFAHWTVNGKQTEDAETLSLIVDKDLTVSASFKQERYEQNITLMRGWNWIASYLADPISASDIASKSSQIISSSEEIENLLPAHTYKVKASTSFISKSKGRLFEASTTPVGINAGWNWLGYPLRENQELASAISNASEGDYIVGQTGFAQFYAGTWEGTLKQLITNQGYLYKSVKQNNLEFAEATTPSQLSDDEQQDMEVDIRKYPSTMNIIGKLTQKDADMTGSDYRLYVMVGNECRGISQLIDGKYYLTIYGEKDEKLNMVIENLQTQESILVQDALTFKEDVLGSRTSPYDFNIDIMTGIENILADGKELRIYSIDGYLIDAHATVKTLKKLVKGVYIINGKKYVVSE
uniref:InlB B-repeat-containing protein n=1 Tax=Prevotella sp. TaxID=59823 RepID=UPI0040271FFB